MSQTAQIIVGKTFVGNRVPVAVDNDGKLQIAPNVAAVLNAMIASIGTHTIVNFIYTGVQITSCTFYNAATLVNTLTFAYDSNGNLLTATKS